MNGQSSSIAESFNARFLDPKQVGSSFVLSPYLEKAIAPENTAILGPRGSGKTTLLKMLTLPALLNWHDPRRDKIAEALNHLSVYVPYSLTWSADYRGFSQRPLDPAIDDLLSVSLFRHSVLLSFLETWKECSRAATGSHPTLRRFFLPIEGESERDLTRHLARLWQLDIPISTINGMKEGIGNRIKKIQRISILASRTGVDVSKIIGENEFLGDNFFDDARSFSDFLTERYNFEKKITLCFDELEIASDVIANTVLRAPRSIPEFFIKFCAAPYVGAASFLNDQNIATPGNDYQLVFLSSFSPSDTRDFSEALFGGICAKYQVEPDHESVLGASLVDDFRGLSKPQKSRYGSESAYQKKFERLYEIDASFRSYIGERQLDIDDLSKGSENKRAATIRKIIWPVLVREEFLRADVTESGEVQRRRLRSKDPVSDIYTGAASLFALCEGNPRALIGLMEPLVQSYARRDRDDAGSVRRSVQKRQIDNLISSYFALLSTVPNSNHVGGLTSLLDLVYIIGEHFRDSVLGGRFNPDPVLSFYTDDKVPEPIKSLVGKGINIGAFITTNEVRTHTGKHFKVGEIGGLKVRLSNIFAPHFKLPLVGGRPINLSTILRRSGSAEVNSVLELFGDKI